MKNFNNKVVVITGASSGMGRAYALAFAAQGCLLALCDINEHELKETINLVKSKFNNQIFYQIFDISNEQATYAFANQVKEELGSADIVINNAGIEGSCRPTWETSNNSFEQVMQVNFFGVLNGTRAFLPQLRLKNSGAIVNVSSIFGLVGTPNNADYCASKFAVRGFTEALMVELLTSNIQVHLLHPGGIDTNITQKAQSKKFSSKFLTTPPADIAQHLIHAIKQNTPRIVYGNESIKTWFIANLLPLKWICKLIWSEVKSTVDMNDYKPPLK